MHIYLYNLYIKEYLFMYILTNQTNRTSKINKKTSKHFPETKFFSSSFNEA